MIGHRLAKCKVTSIVKQDNRTTTSEGPTTVSPSVQSQDAEVVAFTKTNPNNPSRKPKEDQAGLST